MITQDDALLYPLRIVRFPYRQLGLQMCMVCTSVNDLRSSLHCVQIRDPGSSPKRRMASEQLSCEWPYSGKLAKALANCKIFHCISVSNLYGRSGLTSSAMLIYMCSLYEH